MDTVLAGLPQVLCCLDDILLAGVDRDEHLRNLSAVLDRLESSGFTLNKRKCKFAQSSVTYLGHIISKDGLSPTGSKLEAIRDAPQPDDVKSLRSFIGLVMYYSKCLLGHSTIFGPLNKLTRKGVRWR